MNEPCHLEMAIRSNAKNTSHPDHLGASLLLSGEGPKYLVNGRVLTPVAEYKIRACDADVVYLRLAGAELRGRGENLP